MSSAPVREPIRVGVLGATGKVGSVICAAVLASEDMTLVSAVGASGSGRVAGGVPVHNDPRSLVDDGCDVVVDFSTARVSTEVVPMLAAAGVHVVVGTSGLDTAAVDTIRAATADDGSGDGGGDGDGGRSGGHVAIVPNFAISAVLMQRFAELAAPHFDRVEIIEFHHDGKADAPSGTAVATAERIAAARGEWPADPTVQASLAGARGAVGPAGIPIHAVRMRGMNAHQEVILGAQGQTLTLRQDSFDRTSYVPGVLLAVRRIPEFPGLTLGLDAFL